MHKIIYESITSTKSIVYDKLILFFQDFSRVDCEIHVIIALFILKSD